jgi:hypothetical protein
MRPFDALPASDGVVIKRPPECVSELLPVVRQRCVQRSLCYPQQAFLRRKVDTKSLCVPLDFSNSYAASSLVGTAFGNEVRLELAGLLEV